MTKSYATWLIVTGAKYGDVHRSLDEVGVLFSDSTEKEKEELHKIKKEWFFKRWNLQNCPVE